MSVDQNATSAKIPVWTTIGASFSSLYTNPRALWRVFLICILPAMLISAIGGSLLWPTAKAFDPEAIARATGWQRYGLMFGPWIDGTMQWAILCLGAIVWHRALLLDHPAPLSPTGGATKAIRYFAASLLLSTWWLLPFISIMIAALWTPEASTADVAAPESAPAEADSSTSTPPDDAPAEGAPADTDIVTSTPPGSEFNPDYLAWVHYFVLATFLFSLLVGFLISVVAIPFALAICLFALFNRLAVSLPAIALGHAVSYWAAWKATRGNTWRLFIIFTLTLLPSLSLLAVLANVEPDGVWQMAIYNAAVVLLNGTAGLALVSAISFSYRHFIMTSPRS